MSNAETFAFGGISILDSLNIVDYLVFGMEAKNVKVLESIANKITKNEDKLNTKIYESISNNMSYAKSKDAALKEILTQDEYEEISKPNNILGVEYLKALKKLNSKITPIGITRIHSNHNEISLSKNTFASATSIREEIKNSNVNSVIDYIPNKTFKILQNSYCIFNDSMFEILRYKILSAGKDGLNKIYDISEGLENKIYDSMITSKNYDELINNIKSKRYTMSRIKRILIHILLGITKENFIELKDVKYARILKCRNKAVILSALNKSSSIPVISNINSNENNNLDEKIKKSLELDFFATNIYDILICDNINKDLTNKI